MYSLLLLAGLTYVLSSDPRPLLVSFVGLPAYGFDLLCEDSLLIVWVWPSNSNSADKSRICTQNRRRNSTYILDGEKACVDAKNLVS